MIYHITLIRAENGWYSDMGDAKLVGHTLEVVLGIIQRRIEDEVKKQDNPANHFVLHNPDVVDNPPKKFKEWTHEDEQSLKQVYADEAELTDRGGRS